MHSSLPNNNTLKDTVNVLISALNDKENSVNNVVIKSLSKIANTFPNEVIGIICEFCRNSTKVNSTQLANIVKVLEQTCVNQAKKLQPSVAEELINAMIQAMTKNTDYEPTVQMGASAVLVAVGHAHLNLTLSLLNKQISLASVPHYTIVHTLGTLAAVNTYRVVPHIKEILEKMLPLLTMIKHDGVKQAFAYAFGYFAVAVSEQIGDNVEDTTFKKDDFVTEFTRVFEILYKDWFHSCEPKVLESVLEALGPITRLISERKFNETVNKLILSLISLYRKTTINYYYISQCIAYLLSPSALNSKLLLNDNVINSLNQELFKLVLLEPDYDQPHTVKNHFEVLRCFDHMAGQFPEQTIESLLYQCKNNQEKERMKAVIVLTHLTTSSQKFIDKYIANFIDFLKTMTIMEQGLKMKKLLVKAIVGLVYRNCISNPEDFSMIEFIIKHCCPLAQSDTATRDVFDLYDTCRSSLILMCNTVTSIRTQLRNLLLTALTLDDFAQSMSTICYCLTSLSKSCTEVILDEEASENNLPHVVFIRCMTHIAEPELIEKNRNLLLFLEEYSGEIHKNLKNSWTVEVQTLLKVVEKNKSVEQWHELLLDLLVSAIDQVNNDKWVETVSSILTQQIMANKQSSMIKGMSLQYLALLSCHISNVAVVENILKIILLALKSIPLNSVDPVSKAVGIASRKHGEFLMNELDIIYKDNEFKRGSKIMNFFSTRNSKTELELNVVKCALITCYGQLAKECLDTQVLERLGNKITNILIDILKSQPGFEICQTSITTLYEISKALYPASHHSVTLNNRWQLLNIVLDQIRNPYLGKRNVELYPLIVKTSMSLTKLQKGILSVERSNILNPLFNSIFGELSSYKKKYELEGGDRDNDLLAKTLNDSLKFLHDLIKELIIQATCLDTVDDLVNILLTWLYNENDEIRTATVVILQVVFDTYRKNAKLSYETPSKFSEMGKYLGFIVPGVADKIFSVRLTTMNCIRLIIQIQDLYEGRTIEPDDERLMCLSQIQNNILTNDLDMISDYSFALCDAICSEIPHHIIMDFIQKLLKVYDDLQFKSTCISAVLDALFIKKGQELFQNVENIIEEILITMDRVSDETCRKLMKPLKCLTRNHSNAVTAVLLGQKLPLKQSVILCWRFLATDEGLASAIIDNFLRLMTSVELYEISYHNSDKHIAALQPLTLISALGEMLQEETMRPICNLKFCDLFAILYTTIACYVEADAPAYIPSHNKTQERVGFIPNREAIRLSPAKITIATFNAFLEMANCRKMKEATSLCLAIEHGVSSTVLLELAPILSGTLCRHCPQHLSKLVSRMTPYAKSVLPPQRMAAVALLQDLLNYRCNDNAVLTESVLDIMKIAWNDEDSGVRAMALRGAANVCRLSGELRAAALPSAISALSSGVDAEYECSLVKNVPLVAIQGLSRMLTEFDKVDDEYERELLCISQKIRPFMNTECPQLRESSIRLFGIIAQTVTSEVIVEQSVRSLPCFLLHLCDKNPDVVKASKFTLKQVFKTFNVKKSNDFVQTHLLDEGRLYLDEFLSALLKHLADEMPSCISRCLETAVNYLNCAREDIKPYSPLFLGLLYSELYRLKEEHPDDSKLDTEITCNARSRLLTLIKDTNPVVRQNSSMALANVCLVENYET